jgi:hypothetical protein
MIWLIPGLLLAWTCMQLVAQAVWIAVLLAVLKGLALLMSLAAVAFGARLLLRYRQRIVRDRSR